MPVNVLAALSLLIASAPTPTVRPWTPTPEMIAWAQHFVPASGSMRHRARALHQALVSRRGLGISQQTALSRTATEAFSVRQADCVGFAFLYLGLARALDLPAYFVLREDRRSAGRLLGARVVEAHLAVGLWDGSSELVVDHSGFHDHEDFLFIEDDEAEAILWSNRGVRSATEDDCRGAVANLRRALRLTRDPDIGRNLAVVSARCGF
ncbi:MAG: transglutaminase-like domain-containing protein [Thermoanaerobaculia bacterium]|nr:transglutaminase-like domain-containing protein [Thermoanaerobaculia bacterium]